MNQLEQKIQKAVPMLNNFQQILIQWQKKVNLISDKTINNIWERHILDSAQLFFLIPQQCKTLLDVGSGGGFPGIVLSILNQELMGSLQKIFLVESDIKKAVFLQEVIRQLQLKNVKVLNTRMEKVLIMPDIITARAVASVVELLNLVDKNVSRETIMLFPKGKMVTEELKLLPKNYILKKQKNIVNSDGCILIIQKGEK